MRALIISIFLLLSIGCRNFGSFWGDKSDNRLPDIPANTVYAPVYAPAGGSYNATQFVALTSATAGATMCYTTDGVTIPACDAAATCTTGTPYVGTITVSATQTLNAIACKATMDFSAVASAAYTIDSTAPTISIGNPSAAGYYTNNQVTYTTNEACATASITWTRTAGNADGASPHVQALTGAELMSGTHTNVTLTNNPTLVEGTTYTIDYNCTDAAGNAATPASRAGILYDYAVPAISAIAPASSAGVTNTQVSYTLSETCQAGSVTWTRTGGSADGGSPRVQALVGGELSAGAHTGIVLANAPALVSGAIYTITFNCSDFAAQAAPTQTSTAVTFDNVVPVISATSPASSAIVNHSLVSYTFSEACQTASATWTRTGGNPDGASPHVRAMSGGDLASGAHSNVALSPSLVSGTTYSLAFDCTDGVGNTAVTVSNTNITYDTVVPVVSSVTSSLADGSYTTGQIVPIQVVFSKIVNVTGTPQLTISTGSPATTVLNYVSGSGSNTLLFNYTVSSGNISGDLDYASTAALSLNGGTIQDAALNPATLTLVSPGAGGSLGGSKAIIIDTAIPTVSNVTASNANGSYGIGAVITVQVQFSKPVNVTGTPQLTLATGTPATTAINYTGGTGTSTLSFSYTVIAGNVSALLDYQNTASLGLNGGTIRDAALNNATLTLGTTGGASSLAGNKTIVIDGIVPVISAVAPGIGMYVDHTRVSYTVSEACASGSVTWTQTGGVTDPGSPRVQALTGAELGTGVHTNIVLTNNPLLVPGAIYSIAFNCTDAASNAATTITQTNVAFEGVAIWARSTITGANESKFYATTTDSMGNVYAVGYQDTNTPFNYGAGNLTASAATDNAVIVKYDANGNVVWNASLAPASAGTSSIFRGVAVAPGGGTVYAVGNQDGTATYNYGAATAAGASTGNNAVMVAYNASTGAVNWARTATGSTGATRFTGVAVDTTGNINVVGYQTGTTAFNYSGVPLTSCNAGTNSMIIQYNSSGTGNWGKTVTTCSDVSQFNGIAVDTTGNIYVAGQQRNSTSYTYDAGKTATGGGGTTSTYHAVLVKYTAAGSVTWVVANSTAVTNDSLFYGVAVDSSGTNIYAVGGQTGTGSFTYSGPSVSGMSSASNAVLVKYSNAGAGVVARSTTSANSFDSVFYSVAVSPLGNVYAAGAQNSNVAHNYGSGAITGFATGTGATGQNALLVRYDSTPMALWAKTIFSGPAAASLFLTISVDSNGNVFAPGDQTGTGIYNYGPASVNGTYATTFNALLVKYR